MAGIVSSGFKIRKNIFIIKYNTFIATIQLVNHICDAAMYNTDDSIAKLSWSDFVADITEPELIQYLKERQLYVNEEVCAEEEM